MSKDKRKKGCTNKKCDSNCNKTLYNSESNYCPICGSELVFVCPKCFSKIKDSGPEHIMCDRCKASQDDVKEKIKAVGGTIVAGVGAVAINLGPKAILKAAPKAIGIVKKII